MAFDLITAVEDWKRKLKRHQGLEPAYIEELESSLMDRYEDYQQQGMLPKDAFEKAARQSLGDVEEVADEFYKAHSESLKRPPWKNKFDLIYLLPNYLKVTARNLSRKKFYSSLNYFGLVIGLFCVGLVSLYVQYETSWDEFHSKSDRTYRLGRLYRSQGYSVYSFERYWSTSRENQLKQINGIKRVAGIEDACHFWINSDESFVEVGGEKHISAEILSTNTPEAFFEIFDWEFLMGEAEMASSHLLTAVLTRSEAEKIFGPDWKSQDILNTEIEVLDSTYQIMGVVEDVPANSHYEFNIVLNAVRIPYWGSRTYALLEKNADPEQVFSRLDQRMDEINLRLAESELFGGTIYQPIEEIHLHSDLLYEIKPPGEIKYLYVFGIVAGIILLLTVTNYTNLSIALNSGRMREIGMRKVMGAGKSNVMFQFLMEALLLSVLALPVVLGLLQLLIPAFNQFMGVRLSNLFISHAGYFLALTGGALLVGLLAGIYPAFFLSTKAITSLFNIKGMQARVKGLSTRKALITFQFALLIGLSSFTYLINKQLNYVKNKDVGYNKKGILYTRIENDNFDEFKRKMNQLPEIVRVGRATPIGRRPFNQTTYRLQGQDDVFDDAFNFRMTPDAVKAFGIKTSIPEKLENPDQLPDEITLVNEAFVNRFTQMYDLEKQDLVGMQIIQEPEYTQEDGTIGFPHAIHGFYEDINVFSLREAVDPYFLRINKNFTGGLVVVQFDSKNISSVLDNSQEIYASLGQDSPMWYSFMEQNLEELYQKEQRVSNLTIYLSLVAFVVAVLGLVALSALLTTMKRKEVGIRKVLGASTGQIIQRFNSEYIKLIIIALLIAAPVAYYGVSQWLETFAFKIGINPLIFPLAAVLTLLISVGAVSLITYRTALDNPVNALKDDQ